MDYPIEQLGKTLKEARRKKWLTQRQLSAKSGVPQSHISKIEAGTVDLRVSSLIALARVLDLELELIPKKTVPAVQSIVRTTASADIHNIQKRIGKETERYRDTIEKISNLSSAAKVLNLQKDLQFLNSIVENIESIKPDPRLLEKIASSRQALENVLSDSAINESVARQVRKQMNTIRNMSVHNPRFGPVTAFPVYKKYGDNNE